LIGSSAILFLVDNIDFIFIFPMNLLALNYALDQTGLIRLEIEFLHSNCDGFVRQKNGAESAIFY
jgi:hypothetical protein